jgi:hypothetical protein
MKLTLRASTGAKILVWREDEFFHARRLDAAFPAQACLAVDLFEVIAELTGLDLEQGAQAAEAMSLAEDAERRLSAADSFPSHGDEESARAHDGGK